jgi:adenylate cyclase
VNTQTAIPVPRDAMPRAQTARQLFWKLVWLYQGGCAAAIVITMLLALLGLELSVYQWIVLFIEMPLVVAVYNLSDVYLIVRHFRPIKAALEALDRGQQPSEPVLAEAVVWSLNLPFYSFLRVTFVHGPLVTLMVWIVFSAANVLVDAGFQNWQIIAFCMTTMFFASPTHAIFEYFGVSRAMVPTIWRSSSPRCRWCSSACRWCSRSGGCSRCRASASTWRRCCPSISGSRAC